MGDERWVRAALASGRIPFTLARGSRAVLNGFWLGVLSDEQLGALDERFYADAEQYRTEAWNEQGLFPWERQLVEDHFPSGGRVVVVGCGGGREVLALLDAGYQAVGYESHPDLVAFAGRLLASKGHDGCIRAIARDEFAVDAGPCDAVVIGWGTYSLVRSREARIELLRNATRALAAGAPLLLSYYERVVIDREARWTIKLANELRRARRRPPVEAGDTLAPNRIHAFLPSELADEAAAAGLDVATRGTIGVADGPINYAAAILRRRP